MKIHKNLVLFYPCLALLIRKNILLLMALLFTSIIMPLSARGSKTITSVSDSNNKNMLTVYTDRNFEVDKSLYQTFTKETKIAVTVVYRNATDLISKIESDGADTDMDLLFLSDVDRMTIAKNKKLLADISVLTDNKEVSTIIDNLYRDRDNRWIAISMRTRAIVYDKYKKIPQVINPKTKKIKNLQDMEELAFPEGPKILVSPISNYDNISLVSFMLSELKAAKTVDWVQGLVTNFARKPQGNDLDQMRDLIAGQGDIAIVNTYYVAQLMYSRTEAERTIANRLGILFTDPTDINFSAAGISALTKQKDEALSLIRYLIKKESQERFTNQNFEYPIVNDVAATKLLVSWGKPIPSKTNRDFNIYGENAPEAFKIAKENGWQ